MNRVALFLFGSLILLLNSPAAHGQNCFTNHFSIYTSMTRDGTNIHTAVTISGYTSIAPFCNMSSATHKVGVDNLISGTGGWTYSGSSCPSCYFTATGINDFLCQEGLTCQWNWVASAICTIARTFFNQTGGGGLPGCLVPTSETGVDAGFDGASFRERFDMALSDTAGDSFDNHFVEEYTAAPGTNTCWWSGSRLPQNPGTQNSSWTVGTVAGSTEHNHWGYDSLGLDLGDLDDIVQNGPNHGVTFPCVLTIHQGMQIECDATTWWNYKSDDITITVDNSPNSEEACRGDECGLPVGFADRWTESRFEWAAIPNSGGEFSVVVKTAKEARQ